jgi:hypothetical protein
VTSFTGRIDRANSHSYLIEDVPVRGVTTICNGGIPKPALVGWAGKTVAQKAVDSWEELSQLPPTQRYELLKSAQYENRDAAGKQGTAIHRIAEQMLKGESTDSIPAGLLPYIRSCKAFLEDWRIGLVYSELPVFNRTYRYAGTIDLIGTTGTRTILWDFKSNRTKPYGDAAFQAVAYKNAEFMLDSKGQEVKLPHIDQCAIVHIRQNGYAVYAVPTQYEERIFDQFKAIGVVAEAVKESEGYLVEVEPVQPERDA